MKTRYIILYFKGQGDFIECPKIDDLCSVYDTTIIVKDYGDCLAAYKLNLVESRSP